jgi:hypothetical protein
MPSPGVSPDPRPLVAPLKQIPIKFSPFDQYHCQRLIRAREEVIRHVLHGLIPALGLKTALDAGAGVGFFSQTLADCGLTVRGFDGLRKMSLKHASDFLISLLSKPILRSVPS